MNKFSVIIATYNRAAFLPKALDSLLAQSFSNWEAWVVDDGSTDNTEETIAPYLNKGLAIHYIKQENKGVAKARNKALSCVNGAYVTFLDSDDWYKPEHLKSRDIILTKNPDVELLHGGFEVLGDPYVPDKNDLQNKIHLKDCFVGATMFVRKEVIHKLHGFKKLPLGADAEFYERAQSMGVQIMKTDNPTYVYDRTGEESITHSFKADS